LLVLGFVPVVFTCALMMAAASCGGLIKAMFALIVEFELFCYSLIERFG
jgi:hypothetical protein